MPSRADYERFFRDADTDNSGELTFSELLTMLRKKGFRGPDSEIKGYFASVDTSGDNKLSMNEYLVAMGQIPQEKVKEAAMREVFFAFDLNRDGYIEKNELQQAFKDMNRCLSDKEIKRMMELIDSDGDGKCDYEEFLQNFFKG